LIFLHGPRSELSSTLLRGSRPDMSSLAGRREAG
jgi:hypothetical protein